MASGHISHQGRYSPCFDLQLEVAAATRGHLPRNFNHCPWSSLALQALRGPPELLGCLAQDPGLFPPPLGGNEKNSSYTLAYREQGASVAQNQAS